MTTRTATQFQYALGLGRKFPDSGRDIARLCRVILVAVEQVVVSGVGVEDLAQLRISRKAAAERSSWDADSAIPLGK